MPFQRTMDATSKPVPLTVNVAGGAAIGNADGDSDANTGIGRLMVTLTGAEVPPPGDGLKTVKDPLPEFGTDVASTMIVRVVDVDATWVIPVDDPFHRTDDVLLNPVPVSTTVCVCRAFSVAGATDTRVGIGFSTAIEIVFDVPPPGAGLETVSVAAPAEPRATASMATFSVVDV